MLLLLVALARFRAEISLAFLQSTWALLPLRRIAERQLRFRVDVKDKIRNAGAQKKETTQ
jgi:hypothetical protein